MSTCASAESGQKCLTPRAQWPDHKVGLWAPRQVHHFNRHEEETQIIKSVGSVPSHRISCSVVG